MWQEEDENKENAVTPNSVAEHETNESPSEVVSEVLNSIIDTVVQSEFALLLFGMLGSTRSTTIEPESIVVSAHLLVNLFTDCRNHLDCILCWKGKHH